MAFTVETETGLFTTETVLFTSVFEKVGKAETVYDCSFEGSLEGKSVGN